MGRQSVHGGRGSLGGTPYWDDTSSTAATFIKGDYSPTPKSDEGKMAKRILDSVNNVQFSVEFLARYLANNKGAHARKRLLEFAKAIIFNLARQDEHFPDATTKQAKRMLTQLEGRKTTARRS